MKWFRHTLRRSRSFVLAVLAVSTYAMVDGNNYAYAYQAHRQEEARLAEISERLGIPVEELRPERESPLAALGRALGVEPADPVAVAGRARLQAVLAEHEAKVAANPYRPQIEAVKREHALFRIEAAVRDLVELTEPAGELPEGSRRALMRNLAAAVRERPELPPLPAGVSAQAEARHAAMQAKLDRLFESVAPVAAGALRAPAGAVGEDDLGRRVEQLRVFQTVEAARAERGAGPRFADRPLPLRRVERRAERRQVGSLPAAAPSRAVATAPAGAASRSGSGGPRVVSAGAVAPEIAALAHALGDSPAQIFAWVHDRVAFDPKWGAVKGPLGALWEGSGTPWDQAWLLKDLLTAAGVDARFEWGEVEIPTAVLTNVTGLDDPFRAGDYLATAGVPTTLLVQGSQVIAARIDHVWVKAHLDYVPDRGALPGPGDTWVRLDPSLKRYDYAPGIRVHDQVPFSLGGYLLSGTELSPRRFYEDALWAHIRATGIECTTLEQLKRAGRPVAEAFPFVPGTLRGKVLAVAGEAADEPPAGFQQRIDVEVRRPAAGALVAWSAPLPALYARRVEIDYVGATAEDQATLDAHGGVFETPPFLVDLKPVVRLDGVADAEGAAVGSAEDVEVQVTLTPPNGPVDTVVHELYAGEPNVLVTDFGQSPQQLLLGRLQELEELPPGVPTAEVEARVHEIIGLTYLNRLGNDLRDLADWKWRRLLQLGTEGLVTRSGRVTTTVGGSPLTFTRAELSIDVAHMTLGLFAVDEPANPTIETMELLGAQGSYLEGAVFPQTVSEVGVSTVSALLEAQRSGQVVQRVDASNLAQVLAEIDLPEEVELEVQHAVGSGKVAWVPEAPLAIAAWSGVGYVLEDPATGAAGYLISGGLAGGESAGPLEPFEGEVLGWEDWLESNPLSRMLGYFFSILAAVAIDRLPSTNHADPINLAIGNMWFSATDLTIQARGIPILWTRGYNSRSDRVGPLGAGWSFTYGETLEGLPNGDVLYRDFDGSEHLFTADGGGGFVAPAGTFLELTEEADRFVLRTRRGLEQTFSLDGRLLTMADPDGNTVSLTYDGGGNLSSIVDAAGRTVVDVAVSGGRITGITDLAGRTVSYEYDGVDMVRVTDTVGEAWTYAYDAEHNLTARIDPLGNAHTYAYDDQDRCYLHVDPEGHAESFAYSGDSHSAVLTDTRGFDTYVEFDGGQRAVVQVDPLGNVSRSSWDGSNNRLSIVDARDGTVNRTYDERGNMVTEVDQIGQQSAFTYDPVFNQVLTAATPSGLSIERQYDPSGRLITESRQAGEVVLTESFLYNPLGDVVEEIDAAGNSRLLEWETTLGSLRAMTDRTGNRTEYTLDNLGRIVSATDSDGNVAHVAWDDAGRVVEVTDPHGEETRFTYDAGGRRVEIENSRGLTRFSYDGLGRAVAATDVLGNTTEQEFDPAGNVVAVTDARGNRWSLSYDALGRPVGSVDGLGQVWGFAYCADVGGGPGAGCATGTCNGAGQTQHQLCEIVDPLGTLFRQDFDGLGRPVTMFDAAGNATSTEYHPTGEESAVIDPLGNRTDLEYDPLGRLTAVVEADGSRTEYQYDANGNRTLVRDAEGREWRFEYDQADRVIAEEDPLGNRRTYSYDALGNLTATVDGNDVSVQYEYDFRRLTAVVLPDGTRETYTHDPGGRLTRVANAEIGVTLAYDARDRLAGVTDERLGQATTYGYDAGGNLVTQTTPFGTVEYLYDAVNRLVELRDGVTGTFRWEYNGAGFVTRLVYPNGTSTEYLYDRDYQLMSVLSRAVSGDVIDGYSYAYDAARRPISRTGLATGIEESLEYDALGRLTRWSRASDYEEYAYDRVGNRTLLTTPAGATTYLYDAANRLQSASLDSGGGTPSLTGYVWDGAGQLIRKDAVGEITDYVYDPLGRLVEVQTPTATVGYGYDPRGARVRESDSSGSRLFLLNGNNVIGTFDSAGVLGDYYAQAPGLDSPLAERVDGVVRYLHRDRIGSVTSLTSADGEVVGNTEYRPFGEVAAQAGAASSRFGFTSREPAADGLLYYRARYYDPGVGRFARTDFIRGSAAAPQSLNGFAYALNDPLTFTDPLGLFCASPSQPRVGYELNRVHPSIPVPHPMAPGFCVYYNAVALNIYLDKMPGKLHIGGRAGVLLANHINIKWMEWRQFSKLEGGYANNTPLSNHHIGFWVPADDIGVICFVWVDKTKNVEKAYVKQCVRWKTIGKVLLIVALSILILLAILALVAVLTATAPVSAPLVGAAAAIILLILVIPRGSPDAPGPSSA